MKFPVTLVLSFCCLQLFAQYDPVQQSYYFSFQSNDPAQQGRILSYGFEKIDTLAGDSIFYSFPSTDIFDESLQQNYVQPDSICWAWGGCTSNPYSGFAGYAVIKKSSTEFWFMNKDSIPLTFNFGIPVGDSSIFYSDAGESFFLFRLTDTVENILGQTDSVYRYKILHFDSGMQPIGSALNGFVIKLSKDNGLVSFIDVRRFPGILESYNLVGSTKLDAGIVEFRYVDFMDFQVGDMYQTANYSFSNGPPSSSLVYINYTILQKNTVPSGIDYSVRRENLGPPLTIDTITLHADTALIVALPFERSDKFGSILVNYDTVCGDLPLTLEYTWIWGYYYCEEENLYCGVDTYPLQGETNSFHYQMGRGQVYHYYSSQAGGWYGASSQTINYSEFSGNPCGTEQFAGIDEFSETQLKLYPNPGNGTLVISAESHIQSIELYSVRGEKISSKQINSSGSVISLDLTNGMYLGMIIFADGKTAFRKIIISR